MPAALRGERRGAAKPRAKVPPRAARPRLPRPAARGISKLRAAHRVGLPPAAAVAAACMIVTLGVVVVLATGGRGQRLMSAAHGAIDSRFASLGFRLGVIHLQGASPAAQQEILKAAALKFGAPILALDLNAVRARVEGVGWVERARIVRLLPDTLVIAVDQRPLLAVWEHAGRATVIAADGRVLTKIDPSHFTGLPLIVGAGANVAARAILPAILGRPRLAKGLDALVRVDDRRWDIRLKNGGLIMLPSQGEEAALKQLDALDRASRILDLDLARVDLRDPEMVVVRPRGGAAPVLTSGGV
jgi:cell division protein FtsQ